MIGERYSGEQVFGYEELYQNGKECVAHDYVSLCIDKGRYIQIMTPDNYGSSYKEGDVDLTLLRTATYCAHPISPERPLVKPNVFIPKIDQGKRSFRFRLTTSEEGEMKLKSDMFAERPYALNVFPTKGEKIAKPTRIHLSNAEINLVTMKKSLQKEGVVIRLQNCSSQAKEAVFGIDGEEIGLSFGPYEVKTLLLGNGLTELDEMAI